jgi:hypothetical protein
MLTQAFKSRKRQSIGDLVSDTSGVALIEFAMALPVLMIMFFGGVEVSNFAATKSRVSQLALQVADNAARVGQAPNGVTNTVITEEEINDLLVGAQVHSGKLDITGTHTENGTVVPNGRIIVSSLELIPPPVPAPIVAQAPRYRIGWQRCIGQDVRTAVRFGSYGTFNQASGTNMAGMGPAQQQVIALERLPIMFVEVRYRYRPLFVQGSLLPEVNDYQDLSAHAAMMTRNLRLPGAPNNTAAAPIRAC